MAFRFDLETRGRFSIGVKWYRDRFVGTFPLLVFWLMPGSKQLGLIVFGIYFILGVVTPVKPSSLTEEEKEHVRQLIANEND